MVGYLPFVAWFVLLVYCILDIDRTEPGAARALPVHWWFVVVVAVPVAGALAWLAWGRPRGRVASLPAVVVQPAADWSSTRVAVTGPAGPLEATQEADPCLRAELDRIDREFEEMVRRSQERHRAGRSQAGDPQGASRDG